MLTIPTHWVLGMTPAMAAGVADHVWTLDEIVGLLETREQPAKAEPDEAVAQAN